MNTSPRSVTVYPITGRQLFFRVPHSWCEECNLTIGMVRRVAGEFGDAIEVSVKPWFNHLFDALRRGGWHAPVVTIEGRIFSQGVVPEESALREAFRTMLGETPSETARGAPGAGAAR